MTHTLVRRVLAGCSLILLTVTGASAQVFGTFSWQMQPYCNIVSLTLTQTPGGFTVDGSDNQCGAAKLAGAAGMALFNPDGTVGLEFTIVTAPSPKAVHVSASVNPGTGNGSWTDSVGNSGSFTLSVLAPARHGHFRPADLAPPSSPRPKSPPTRWASVTSTPPRFRHVSAGRARQDRR
jgi:hypothetical protein